jgi:hypothetical protein
MAVPMSANSAGYFFGEIAVSGTAQFLPFQRGRRRGWGPWGGVPTRSRTPFAIIGERSAGQLH